MSRPFQCRRCKSRNIEVSAVEQMLSVHNGTHHGRTLHVGVRCQNCGEEWFSRHKDALRIGREKDAEAAAIAGRPH
jgi:uncharacterized OB-fold protein